MSKEPTKRHETVRDAGASSDQHITGSPETGEFLTDKAPAADTPATGSSNLGVNTTGANRAGGPEDPAEQG
jgi:hypothetical protein